MKYKNRLYELRGNKSQKEFAKEIGMSQQNYANYENGKQSLRSDLIEKICRQFKCSAEWLLGMSEKNGSNVSPMPMATVPLLGTVHAGDPQDHDEYEYRTIKIPQFLIDADPDCYALEAEGDCMNRVYPEGCTIAVSPNKEPVNGSVAVVSIDGREAVMRRMYRTPNTLVLSPDSFNPNHDDIVITSDTEHTIEFLGKVVWFQAREEME